MDSQVTRLLTNTEHDFHMMGRQLQLSQITRELIAELQRLRHDLPQEVINDHTELILYRVSVCVAARSDFITH